MNLPREAVLLRPESLVAACGVLLLTILSFFWFPGHTFLQSDTQIYVAILEHLRDPAALANDPVAARPHVSFTIYDELALVLERITGAGFDRVLLTQQFVYRALGICGLFLVATGAGLSALQALLVAALVSLGAVVNGPAVLTVEYEPVPRAFALPFVVMSMGCLAHQAFLPAAVSGGISFLFHPPTAAAYCLVLFLLLAYGRHWRAAGKLVMLSAVLLAAAMVTPAPLEPPALFDRIDPALEKLQRMRAPYNWVSLWLELWWLHYTILLGAGAAAFWRIRSALRPEVRRVFALMPAIGVLSIPISYLLLERGKWILTPQFQPGRYLLFITLMAALGCALASVRAAAARRPAEAALFALVPLAIPQDPNITQLTVVRLALTAGLALFVAFSHYRAAAVLAGLLPFLLLPTVGKVVNYPELHSADADDLARWVAVNTPASSVFHFAGMGRRLEPGVFRARAKRAIYVDWKGGGQINFLPSFAKLWSERWYSVQKPRTIEEYRRLGIDYVVFSSNAALPAGSPVYSNGSWAVYGTGGEQAFHFGTRWNGGLRARSSH